MLKIKKQNILINNAGAGFLISSTGVIYSTGAWGCSHQIYYSFSFSESLLRIHSLLITISSSSRRTLKSVQCEKANSYILSMSTAPVISPLLMISSNNQTSRNQQDGKPKKRRSVIKRLHQKQKETIILTNEDDGFYDVYTFNQSLQKRLRVFSVKYPDDCWLKGSSEDGSETYMIKKGRLSLNLRPPYSKDRIHKATERIIEEQKEQSEDS